MRLPAFLALTATTIAAVAIAGVLVAGQPRPSSSTGTGGLFFPALSGAANRIASIEIRRGGDTTTIALGEHGWGLKERGDYPVSVEKIKRLVVSLAQLRRMEAKTDRPERYASIGVEDVAPGAESTLVTLADAQGQPLARLLVGEIPTSGATSDAHFVRQPDDSRAWLASGAIDVDPAVSAWVEQTVVTVPGERVAEVKITRPDGSMLTSVKENAEAAHFTLREVPHNHRLKREDAADGLAGVLSDLQQQDLAMADQVPFPADGTTHARFRTFDGLIVDVDLVERDGKDWVRLSSKAAPNASPEAVAEAAALTERTKNYVFNVYSWKVAPLKRSLDDLIEPGSGS